MRGNGEAKSDLGKGRKEGRFVGPGVVNRVRRRMMEIHFYFRLLEKE